MGYTDPMMVLVALLVIGLVIAVIMMMSQPQTTNTVYVRDGRDHWYHRWFNRAEEPRFRPMLY